MAFDQALRLTSILLASASFIGLALGAALPEWLTLLTGSALILVLLRTLGINSIERYATVTPFSAITWNILGVIGFLGFWVDLAWISGELLQAGVRFLLILMVIKLFNLHLRRDYLHLYAISFMAILAAASVTTDLWYLPIFVAYLVTGVWALILFQLTKKSEDVGSPVTVTLSQQGPIESSNRITSQLFWMANGLAVAAFALTIVIFFTIPRVNAGFYQKGYGDNIRTSGFSDTVNLGAIGPIKRDPSIVMRVELPDGPPQSDRFYVRGMAFDRYDGRSWTNQLNHRWVLSESTTGTFTVRKNRPPDLHQGVVLRQKILLESLDTPVLFAAPFAETIEGRFSTVQSDQTGALYLPFPNSSRIEYSVISRSSAVVPGDFEPQSVSYPDSFARHYLQVPVQSERIAALAHDIISSKRSYYDKVVAIQEHLIRNFRYSLDAPLAEQTHPLEEFLFARKTGYCEHYATAMIILLRTIGIPARLVTGFLATEWNEYGNYYVVRQQDAHAWVEVHLPHSGWIMMDPTPAATEAISTSPLVWQALGRMIDSMRLRWSRFFVGYSADDQMAVVRELKAGSASVSNGAWDSLSSAISPVISVFENIVHLVSNGDLLHASEFIGLILIGLSALLWSAWRQPRTRTASRHGRRDDDAITRVYQRMIGHLAKQGISKPLAMPPMQFMRAAQDQWKEIGSIVAVVTEMYCRARFGRMTLTDEELRTAQQHIEQLMAAQRL